MDLMRDKKKLCLLESQFRATHPTPEWCIAPPTCAEDHELYDAQVQLVQTVSARGSRTEHTLDIWDALAETRRRVFTRLPSTLAGPPVVPPPEERSVPPVGQLK